MKKNLHLGDEWLFFKIYTNEIHTDDILLKVVYPIFLKLNREDIISNFFFIRYKDPYSHLRVRFKLKDTKNISYVLGFFNKKLKPFILKEYVWKVTLDRYEREIYRYGSSNIENTEKLFCFDSINVLKMLIEIRNKNLDEDQKILISINYIKSIVNLFDLGIEQKVILFTHMSESFHLEFQTDKIVKKRLNQFYQRLMNLSFSNNPENQISNRKKIKMDILKSDILKKIKIDKINLNDYLFSVIHMFCNRFFNDNNRKMELIVYDIVLKEYKKEMYKIN